MRLRRLLGPVAGAATMIAALTIVSRVLGFGRWLVQAETVGSGAVGDAYASANLVPNVLYEVVAGGALAGAVIPLLAGPIARSVRADTDQISSALLTWAFIGLTPVAVALSVFARPLAALLPEAAGADPAAQLEATTRFLQIFAPQVVLYGIGVVLTGVLQAHRRFLAPVLAPIASTLVVIVSYLVFGALANGLTNAPDGLPDAAFAWLAWGTTAGVAALSLPLLVPVYRCGVRLRPTVRFPPGVAVRARSLALAGLGSLLAQQASVLSVLWVSRAGGSAGTIVVFQWAQAVYLLPYAVLAVPVATAVFPRLAELASSDQSLFRRTTWSATRAVVAVAILGAGVLVAVAPAVQQLFARCDGMGQCNDTTGMAQALTAMAPGVIGLSMIFLISRALYSMDRSRAAVSATALGWLVVTATALLGVAAFAPDGGEGAQTLLILGVAHTAGMTVAGSALIVLLASAMHTRVPAELLRTCVVAGGGAVVGAVLGRWATGTILDLAGPGAVAAVLAGTLGGMLAMLAVAGAVALADRGIVRVLRRSRA
ncbi:murein biosynthesis integral membrane protein MurJ [Ruania halotolerans]|uniref:murein biosynthesis integral membrane protein MurJ n=1 Tax=Ruania halotolerans TaxID=2897773 RepID=UPI001E4068F3|nr:lipid II flippase MurJ [Ruania halotolerans]UFU05051.1 virulence factor MviN [Ruania halotolerans]